MFVSNPTKKRKLLDHYSSDFIRPSKYLLLEQSDEDSSSPPEEEANLEELESSTTIKVDGDINMSMLVVSNALRVIANDGLIMMNIFEFLEMHDGENLLFVCKTWTRLLVSHFVRCCNRVYDGSMHLSELIEEGIEKDNGQLDGLYTELATWKAPLCYFHGGYHLDDEEYSGLNWDRVTENEVEYNGRMYRQKVLPFGVPLCKGTIADQYSLVSSEIDSNTYREMVENFMRIPKSEQGPFCYDPFEVRRKIEQEKEMVDVYVNETHEALQRDSGGPVDTGDGIIYDDDPFYNISQCDSEFTFFALRSGIQRLSRRGGVKFFEPPIIEDILYELKRVIHLSIKDAYERKFPNKTEDLVFEESQYQYNRYCVNPHDAFEETFNDHLDTDLKLNHEEILNSFERVTGLKVMYAPVKDPYDLGDRDVKEYYARTFGTETVHELPARENQSSVNEESTETKVEDPKEKTEEEEEDDEESEESDDEEEEEEEDLEIVCSTDTPAQSVVTEENFIDDSNQFNFDLDNLGSSLDEKLMAVSIRVHEEVYGKEQAHKEKLYLKNWYGSSDMFFTNCSKEFENPDSMIISLPPVVSKTVEEEQDPQPNEESQENIYENIEMDSISIDEDLQISEKDNIETISKEDLEYFGYTLYDDDFDEFPIINDNEQDDTLEQASEEESLRYQLRRMLREQSYECIVNFTHPNQNHL